MDPIIVRHPVPVRIIPRNGFRERVVFASGTTPVRLREASRSEMRHVVRLDRTDGLPANDLYEMEGRLWLPVSGLRTKGGGQAGLERAPYTGDDLRAFLESGHAPLAHTADFFYGTPLCASELHGATPVAVFGESVHMMLSLGHVGVRRVVEDTTERARRDLLAFLEEGLVLVDGEAYLRARPLYMLPRGGYRYEIELHPQSHYVTYASGPDRADLATAFERGFQTPQGLAPAARVPEIDRFVADDADLVRFANIAPRWVLSDRYAKALPATPSERLEALWHWRALGSIGSITREEAQEVLPLIHEQIALILDRLELSGGIWRDTSKMLRYVEDIALPALVPEPELREEDAVALDGLGLGGLG